MTKIQSHDITGYTLLELLIAIAIIGIMSAAALPLYSSYVSRSQIVRVHNEISQYTRAIEDRLSHSNTTGIATNPESTLGFSDSNLSSVVFGSFTDASTSTITATMDGDTSSTIQGTSIKLQRAANGAWTCVIIGAGGGWRETFKPSGCS